MGIYLNPGNDEFYNAEKKSKIYVDKTELLAFTNSVLSGEHMNICVNRPCRFGKSIAANMLVAYYCKIAIRDSYLAHLKYHQMKALKNILISIM